MKDPDEAALRLLGHWDIGVVRKTNDSGFFVLCDCGYRSTHRSTMKEAVQTAMHHRMKMLKEARSNGVSLPSPARSVQ